MDGVGVVPHQREVGRGAGHLDERLHLRLGEAVPAWVGVHRYGPQSADARVARDESLDRDEVERTVHGGYGDHPDSQCLADREMPVIPGHRAQERDVLHVAPWTVTAWA